MSQHFRYSSVQFLLVPGSLSVHLLYSRFRKVYMKRVPLQIVTKYIECVVLINLFNIVTKSHSVM